MRDMIKEMDKETPFNKLLGNQNKLVDSVQIHWRNGKNQVEVASIINGENIREENPGNLQIVQQTFEKTILKGKMQAKLVSLRKLALFWDMAKLSKVLSQLYAPFHFNEYIYVIRVYDVSQIHFNGKNAHHFYDMTVPDSKGYWFVKGLMPNRSYVAEMGVQVNENRFLPLLRSNVVHTPKLEIAGYQAIYRDVFQLHQFEEKMSDWLDHVSTFRYYIGSEKNTEV